MPRVFPGKVAFNGGELSPTLAARVDFGKYDKAAEVYENFLPLIQGVFDLRPGMIYAGPARSSDEVTLVRPFSFNVEQSYVVEWLPTRMRFWRDGALILAEETDADVPDGGFATGISDWDDWSTGSSSIAHDATHNRLSLVGSVGGEAVAEIELTTSFPSVQHALRFRTFRGKVTFQVGTVSGGSDVTPPTELGPGHHVMAFTPGAGTFYVQFTHAGVGIRQIDSVVFEADSPLVLITPYAEEDLRQIQRTQSADVQYLTHEVYPPAKLERRGHSSWSLVEIEFQDGPYRKRNTDSTLTLTPSAIDGAITLTASRDFFVEGHVGACFRLLHPGATEEVVADASDEWTDPIRIEGSGGERYFTVALEGSWVGTVSLQRSYDGGFTWVLFKNYTENGSEAVDDELSQTVHYRLGFGAGAHTSGSATLRLTHAGGETWGWCRVVEYVSPTVVEAEVGSGFSSTEATSAWREGAWSTYRGFPVTSTLYGGRLWLAGHDLTLWGSKSDDYEVMTPGTADDDAVAYTVTTPDVNAIRSITGASGLFINTAGGELVMRGATSDGPLTPTNVGAKAQTTRGSAELQPVMVDRALLFVQRYRKKVFEQIWDLQSDAFAAHDLTEIADHIAGSGEEEGDGFVDIAYQHEPVSRIYLVRSDGECAVLTYRREQEVFAWSRIVTDGAIESVAVIPGPTQSQVWFVVRREVDGDQVRSIEYLAPEGLRTAQADGFYVDAGLTYRGAATDTISGAEHLRGESVAVVVDGAEHPNVTIASDGTATLDWEGAVIHVGRPYRGLWKSLRLEAGNPAGSSIGQTKKINKMSLIVHKSGTFKAGTNLDHLEDIYMRLAQQEMDEPPELMTGQVTVKCRGESEEDPRLYIVQDRPLPLRLLALVPHLSVTPK